MNTLYQTNFFLNEILIRRKNKVLLFPDRSIDDIEQEYITTIMKNIESLGYTFSKDLFYSLQKYDKKYFQQLTGRFAKSEDTLLINTILNSSW